MTIGEFKPSFEASETDEPSVREDFDEIVSLIKKGFWSAVETRIDDLLVRASKNSEMLNGVFNEEDLELLREEKKKAAKLGKVEGDIDYLIQFLREFVDKK